MMKELFEDVYKDIDDINNLETKTLPIKIIKFNEEFGEFSA